MPAIKSTEASAAKWARRAGNAGPEYEEGVRNPRKSWAAETAASAGAYEKGVQASIANKSFEKGVKAAGDSKWQTNAIEKGPARFQQGVNLGEDAYSKGFAPYRAVIANTALPKRGPKGDPNNINRVSVLAKALHDAKLQRKG